MAVSNGYAKRRPSRFRRGLTASALMLTPVGAVLGAGAALADGVLVIDSRGANFTSGPLADALPWTTPYANGAVVVDLGVLDGGAPTFAPITLRPPRDLLAEAPFTLRAPGSAAAAASSVTPTAALDETGEWERERERERERDDERRAAAFWTISA